jgi:ATP/maltotriose-dependent transcriptional regulator MalT
MHQHDVARAIPLLERAVDEHHELLRAEAPRSRVYLAMALRTAGRYAEATKQLDTARRELDEHTLRWFDRPAYRISLAYWSYERARLHVAMDQPDSALEHVETALDLLRPHDDWPRIGILRTAAWAHRLRGEHERADALAAAIRSHRDRFPWRELLDALAVEASGMPGGRNVVY